MNNIYHFAMHLFQSIKKGKKSRQRAFMGVKKKATTQQGTSVTRAFSFQKQGGFVV